MIYALKTAQKHYGRRPRNPQAIVVCYRLFVILEESEMAKQRVGIVFGGKSAEHEVSLQSAKNIVDAIDKSRFDVVLLGIDKQGQWHVNDASQYLLNAHDPAHIALNPSEVSVATVPGVVKGQLIDAGNAQALAQIDVVFPIVHGTLGEDGSLQGMLRMANLPFVGSDVLGSAACMDKDVTKRLLRDAGLAIAPFITLTRANRQQFSFTQVKDKLGLPLFVKPAREGSSIGVTKVKERGALKAAYEEAARHDPLVIAEKGVMGGEYTVGIVGDEVLPIIKIEPATEFYDYEAKYLRDDTQYRCPCDFTPEREAELRAMALEGFRVLGCRGWARIDFLMDEDGRAYLLEANTSPGMTSHSLVPMAARAAGMSYEDLVVRVLSLAELG